MQLARSPRTPSTSRASLPSPIHLPLPIHPPAPGDYRLSPLADIPEGGRQEHAAIFLPPDTIAMVGGIAPDASAKVAPFSSTDMVQLYSITNDSWRTVAPLTKPLNHPNVAAANGKIYRAVTRAVPDSWAYDPATDAWSSIPPPEPARAQAAVADKNRCRRPFAHVSAFDTDTSAWVTDSLLPAEARHLPEPRDHARAAVVEGKIYAIGGFNFGGFNQTDSVFILDLDSLEAGWETGAAGMPTPRATYASGAVGKKIFTIGGEGNSTAQNVVLIKVFDEVEVYDVDSATWTQLSPPSSPRQGPGVGVGGKIFIPGGMETAPVGPLSRFDVFVPSDGYY
ncbi:kelch repeat-containing protein [Macrophomina phaseolina]|uniref:Kelch repeat-containing protein n=1 Tax=Macrophomina phaseolina TaxID=35725 RepID=A0ABQ8G4V4_9PEZI|nr:kelch repeat-containing protein [Macrophomina phaseolina]